MWFTIQDQQVKLRIIAKPNAKKNALVKIDDKGLHVAIHAKPYKGKANEELIEYLSELFDAPKSLIILKSGENSKYKQIVLPLTDSAQIALNNIHATMAHD